MSNIRDVISAALGKKKAKLVLKNCKIINVFTEEIIEGDVAIEDDKIVGIGEYEGEKEINLNGKYVSPGFIDCHMHIESCMVSPKEFAKTVIKKGTTTVIADPHEIANVKGLDGISYILDETEDVDLDVFVMLPSCVPATEFENSGAILKAEDLEKLIDHKRVLGLGEMMNYPGVINLNDDVIDKLERFKDMVIDGHGPVISGKELNGYVSAGIRTEHECTDALEMLERMRLGMYVQLREGSAAKNLLDLVKGLSKSNMSRVVFCTDDRHPEDIIKKGHINNNVKIAVKSGIPAINAIKIATLNAAECYRFHDRGAIAPGYLADLLVFDNLYSIDVEMVIKNGEIVFEDGQVLKEYQSGYDERVYNSMSFPEVTKEKLQIPLHSDIAHVIKLVEGSIITKNVSRKVHVENGFFTFHDKLDMLKVAVVERHNNTGNVGLGLVENFKLKGGAIATTVAHDSHNLIVVGDSDKSMLVAIEHLRNIGGGIVVVKDEEVVGDLSLPIAGLMSDQSVEYVNERLESLISIAHELGVNKEIDPFMTLAFIALPVIPSIRITDRGLFDVESFEFISVEK